MERIEDYLNSVVPQNISKKKKQKIAMITIVIFLVIIAGHMLLNPSDEVYRDGRATFSSITSG